jgi:hypothetical protein
LASRKEKRQKECSLCIQLRERWVYKIYTNSENLCSMPILVREVERSQHNTDTRPKDESKKTENRTFHAYRVTIIDEWVNSIHNLQTPYPKSHDLGCVKNVEYERHPFPIFQPTAQMRRMSSTNLSELADFGEVPAKCGVPHPMQSRSQVYP